MKYLNYLLFRLVVALFAILPFNWMYRISDFMQFIFHKIIRYRYSVIRQNLQKSFPSKNEQELKILIKKIYENLCDILLEGLKGFSMNEKEILKRYKILNPEVADHFFEKNQNIIGLCSHYSNWEWAAHALSLQLQHQSVALALKVKNPHLDQYIRASRSHQNMKIIHASDAAATLKNWKGKPALFVFLADQSPPKVALKKAHWTTFLNQKTPFLKGAERMARWQNTPVIHMKANRVKRGFYEVTFNVIATNPKELNPGKITEIYAQELAQQIIEQPHQWLWSHRRWKHADEYRS